ncbi:hypothetical protein NM22_16885 [Vibrio tubiashii]|nr:hypothetical protein NM22_16885 [Vibrio tubiashii]
MALTAELLEPVLNSSDIKPELNKANSGLRVVENVKQIFTKLNTAIDVETHLESNEPSNTLDVADSKVVTQSLDLEAEYYCVAASISRSTQTLEARVYDIHSNSHIMDLEVPFGEFSLDDQTLIKENAIFYWRIGTKTTTSFNKKKSSYSNQNTTFSSFKMRRVFTRRQFHKSKIDKRVAQLKTLFS